MVKIRLGIVGVGNCASSLLQGIEYYRNGEGPKKHHDGSGLMHLDLGGYSPGDIEVVCAFDIDVRKVGKPLETALTAPPNNTMTLYPKLPNYKIRVEMGPVLDGFSEHMLQYPEEQRFVPDTKAPVDVAQVLRATRPDVVVSYLPVGSQKAAEHYARACLDESVSFINCMPTFIVSNPEWGAEFARKKIPVIGDDIKSQLGATIVHRGLARLFEDRGIKIERTYQLNTGGNTDFLNMLNRERLSFKKQSKTSAVQSMLAEPLAADNVHIGPSDYVPWQKDNKICFLRIEGRGFGGARIELELRLSVEDSPNSAGVAIDAIRCCKVARDRGVGGPLIGPSAYFMKHPPRQIPDHEAGELVERFIRGEDPA
ncbi:MAG: myo-inositol-phosphate synthase [Candidatus Binatota bacterium]|jgi:myo-inositol-1-phosphate synthase|nr:myo-inositol-phosphate synthase [Candidatus Binatota bacterium]